jgi:hypothetical protein
MAIEEVSTGVELRAGRTPDPEHPVSLTSCYRTVTGMYPFAQQQT